MIRISKHSLALLAGAAALLGACQREANSDVDTNVKETTAVANDADADGLPTTQSASVPVMAGDGSPKGNLTVTEDAGGIVVALAATGLPEGVHGVHLHTTGLCEGPKFESAGGHWNPSSKKHGRDNPAGAHLGDLDNLTVGADGSATLRFTVNGATLAAGTTSLADADGTAFVIHAKADDYKTDPSGDSGDRIACAVIAPAQAPKSA
ncbi:superoxide dismutase family protein [Sphingomonas rhizophila]|uniref:Superoxide dismutase [Cu-Zn] n=1 Tax=Sphingomonas rhizophila TaxID=2071607 RepID=A0A7G9SCE9_9SPHN|nr:superoxide dismutase family protein [Sphingomonas rhizophila]QNN65524.1 superoxide dismutase family protein [Sphingomonas rhizophila]